MTNHLSDQPKPMTEQEYNLARLEAAEGLRPYPEPIHEVKEGEWTGMTVANISAGCVHITPVLRERIADAHNAALSSAKAGGWISQEALDEYAKVEAEHRELREQLAAERERINPLVDALKSARKDNDELWTDVTTEWRAKLHHRIRTTIDAALENVKAGR